VAATPGRGNTTLRAACNASVLGRQCFRAKHLEYAARYIHQPSERATANPAGVGTGGTPFMSYLKKHCDETEAHLIR
jgi:indoleamine 2,3-dioxygenase